MIYSFTEAVMEMEIILKPKKPATQLVLKTDSWFLFQFQLVCEELCGTLLSSYPIIYFLDKFLYFSIS